MVVIREGSGEDNGEDNGVVASVENPAITQEPVKRIKKRIVHRNKRVEFSYLGWLSYKMKIIDKISSEAFLVKLEPPFRTSSKDLSLELGFETI